MYYKFTITNYNLFIGIESGQKEKDRMPKDRMPHRADSGFVENVIKMIDDS